MSVRSGAQRKRTDEREEMSMLTSKKKGYRLSPETVDLLSQEFADSLTEAEAD